MPKRKNYNFYAVSVGRKPGLYGTWTEAERQVVRVTGARHEGFNRRGEALAYLERHGLHVRFWDRDGAVIRKSGGRCWYCGELLTDDLDQFGRGEIEHQVPSSRGGSPDLSNLVLACRACNERKAARTSDEFREPGQVFYGEAASGS